MSDADNHREGCDLLGVREEELYLILGKRESTGQGNGSPPEKPVSECDKDGDRQRRIDTKAWDSGLFGLALSGGGIRSATFNLGILQSLAGFRLLRHIDYLSTVSGGGYIGGWFTALLQRENHRLGMSSLHDRIDDEECKQQDITPGQGNNNKNNAAILNVEERLNPHSAANNKHKLFEDPAISHLRSYSNYLTPKFGFFTADTWVVITTYLRNVIPNLTILILTIAALLLVPRLASEIHSTYNEGNTVIVWGLILVTLCLAGTAGWYIGKNLAAVADTDPAKPNPNDTGELLVRVMGPLVAIAILSAAWLPTIIGYIEMTDFECVKSVLSIYSVLQFAAIVAVVYLAVWGAAMYSARRAFSKGWLSLEDPVRWRRRWISITVFGVLSALMILVPAGIGIDKLLEHFDHSGLSVLLGPALILIAVFLAAVFHIGLASKALKSQQREWLSRIGAWVLIATVGWVAFAGIAFIGPFLFDIAPEFLGPLISSWVAVTIAGLIAGRGSEERKRPGLMRSALIAVAPYVFIVGLVLLLAAGVQFGLHAMLGLIGEHPESLGEIPELKMPQTHQTISGVLTTQSGDQQVQLLIDEIKTSGNLNTSWSKYLEVISYTETSKWWLIPGAIVLFFMLSWMLSRRIDINEFSLHNMYQNRLARCYLGATTECRYQNPFTGFSMQDDMPLWASAENISKSGLKYRLGLSEKEIDALQFAGNEKGARIDLSEKKRCLAGIYPGPYPLINTAINLVGGRRLAWQERKAASFLLSPLYCGFQLPPSVMADSRCRNRVTDKQECNYCIRSYLDDMGAVDAELSRTLLDKWCPFNDRTLGECLKASHEKTSDENDKAASGCISVIKRKFMRLFKCIPEQEENLQKKISTYRPTITFGSQHSSLFAGPSYSPLTLGDTIATSGAAASPNMGYHTTPAFAFLLAVFNIRLGRWIGNPLRSQWKSSGPCIALWHLIKEVFGITNEDSEYVYLSDGGHFENLGIYELVRRRCRYIIACDAGADDDYSFEDLANAIRKCRIDHGVDIDIDVSAIRPAENDGYSEAPCALGKIHYPDGKVGTLLYIKACRVADIPTDVHQYAAEHKSFPHQTTIDQFFSESQFESYRRLGLHIGEYCFSDAMDVLKRASDTNSADDYNIEKLFRYLMQRWYRRSSSIEANFTRLAASLDALFRRLSEDRDLAFLDKQFYPEWRVLGKGKKSDPQSGSVIADSLSRDPTQGMLFIPESKRKFRAGFYFCSSLIQLMENVYHDLNLEVEHDHPDNSGWMNLFRQCGWSGMFRVTWAISSATYGRRFRSFCQYYLDLKVGDVSACIIDPALCNKLRTSPDDPGFFSVSEQTTRNVAGKQVNKCREVTLNALERRQIARILEKQSYSDCRVYQLDLRVNVPEALRSSRDESETLLSFNYGFAIVRKNSLVMFRVQDHLRNMGLGRRGLYELLIHNRNLVINPKKVSSLLHLLKEDRVENHLDNFVTMFQSVKRELELHV